MKEKVVVNTGIPKFLPKFENPIYKAAQSKKEELRNEILMRIKTGDFKEGLYPLINNITLTKEEVYEILVCWKKSNNQTLLFLYELLLITNDLEQIKKADEYLKALRLKEEGNLQLG